MRVDSQQPSAAFVLLGFWGSIMVSQQLQGLHSIDALASVSKTKRASRTSPSSSRAGGGGGFGGKKLPDFVHAKDDTEATQRLVQFLTSQGAKGLNHIDVGFHRETGRRGLFCTRDVKKGQYVCQIPSDCALALSDPSKNGDDAPTDAHGGANLLEMYMHDQQARQVWSPYLDTLPTYGSDQFDPTPDFFVDDDLDLLEFPRIIRMAKDRKTQIQTVAAERGITSPTAVEELRFATWLTASRSFELSLSGPSPSPSATESNSDENSAVMPKYDDKGQVITKAQQKKIRVLVPFIDLANHSSDQPNCKVSLIDPEKDNAWFALEATRPIAPGKELVFSYGNGVESSVELLLNYGFVPSSNRIDSLMLKKGGEGCITSLDGWTTTLDEDKTMLEMAKDDPTLQKILRFRIRLKESYDR